MRGRGGRGFRGDGEILANPIGTIPMVGGRLARATFEPDLMMTDSEATLIANDEAFALAPSDKVVEIWNPYRSMFDIVWSGKRHVMMGATQVDRYGNQNIAAIGDYAQPKAQLLGYRGAPGNTINNTTSYWVPNHSPQVVCAEGRHRVRHRVRPRGRARPARRRASTRSGASSRTSCVLDFETPDHRMRLRSVHPGVTVDEVVAATGFELVDPRRRAREPAADRRRAAPPLRGHRPGQRARPRGRRTRDPPGAAHARRASSSACAYPIVQTGMGWVAGARLTSATSAAGGLGILASATMTLDQLVAARSTR